MPGTLDKRLKDHLRCVALVLLDELTGNMVVHIGTIILSSLSSSSSSPS